MFSKKFVVGPSDADQNLNAKISTLFVYMQDVSMEHAEQLGIGKEATTDNGMMWVITRYSLTIQVAEAVINRLPFLSRISY